MVALNNWSINSVESLFASPVSVGQNLTSYLVDSNSPSEGILLSYNVVSWSVITCTYVVDSLAGILNQVLPVSFFTVNWTVRVVRVDRLTWSYWVWIIWSDGLSLVLQVNNKVVAFLFIDLAAISEVA